MTAPAPIFSKAMTGRERATFSSTLCCLLKELEGHRTTIELRSEVEVTGLVDHVDGLMNIHLSDVTYQTPHRPSAERFENMHVHGRQVRFVHIPDQINMTRAIAKQLDTHRPDQKKFGSRKQPRYLGKKRAERDRILAEHAAKMAAQETKAADQAAKTGS